MTNGKENIISRFGACYGYNNNFMCRLQKRIKGSDSG